MVKKRSYCRWLVPATCLVMGMQSGFCYELPESPSQMSNSFLGSVIADMAWHADGSGTVGIMQVHGSDSIRPYGHCHTTNELGRSCLHIVRGSGDDETGGEYEKVVKWCLPRKGPGTVTDAINRDLLPLFRGTIKRYRIHDQPMWETTLTVSVCEWASTEGLTYTTEQMPPTGTSCMLVAPVEVNLGTTSSNIERTVHSEIRCYGPSRTNIRVIVQTGEINPAAGVTIWSSVDPKPHQVNGDGTAVDVPIKLGVKVVDGTPGVYSEYFIYMLEYL